MQPCIRQTQWGLDRSSTWIRHGQDIAPQQDAQKQRKRQPALYCAQCRQRITEHAARMEFAGAHQHVFTNPGGYTYDIALYVNAECIHQGPATTEYTWFNGFAWRLALCRNCHVHLGWHYARDGHSGFYGLISARLVDINEE